jgi:hypothetical protein
MPTIIRYAISVTFGIQDPRYVARESAMSSPGQVSAYVEDAKTFASPKTAQRWMDERPEWVAYRTKNGGTIAIMPVKMGQRHKTVPVALAA